ncbi:MAG: GGDEF domain-containing protein, partial [Gammaproteobacteria bacterium]|nr:GGDEF domain-containing protein [Gammaproteobacteria bacterium]
MRPLRRRFVWVPTVLVLAVVLLGGARLLDLNVRHHIQVAHERARATAADITRRIEPQLQALTVSAVTEAQRLGAAAATSDQEPDFAGIAPHRAVFWMSATDEVRGTLPGDRLAATGLAAEWRAAEASHRAPPRALIGPVRLGSEWFLAARAPVPGPASLPPRGYAVAYTALDPLLASSGLTQLLGQGYVFELSQAEPRSARSRSFVSTAPGPLTEPVRTQIRLPSGVAAVPADSELELALQPRAGWYPRSQYAASVALLVFLAWLLAFGTHDLTHALQRSRTAMRGAHARLHGLRARLALEIREHQALQQTFDHERFHDPFTGLPNRRYFMDQVDRALRDLRTKRRAQLTVLIIDIVRFKLVNDMLGHTAGDELMVQAARRFEQTTAERSAVLARWSGDQFVLLVTDLAGPEAAVD